jgi:enterochelin esterase-like enzyme
MNGHYGDICLDSKDAEKTRKLLAQAISDGEIQDIDKRDRMNGQSSVLKLMYTLASSPTV